MVLGGEEMYRYKVEQCEGGWCVIDTLQQRMVIEAETFAVCDQLVESLKRRALPAKDEVTEMDEVAAAILGTSEES